MPRRTPGAVASPRRTLPRAVLRRWRGGPRTRQGALPGGADELGAGPQGGRATAPRPARGGCQDSRALARDRTRARREVVAWLHLWVGRHERRSRKCPGSRCPAHRSAAEIAEQAESPFTVVMRHMARGWVLLAGQPPESLEPLIGAHGMQERFVCRSSIAITESLPADAPRCGKRRPGAQLRRSLRSGPLRAGLGIFARLARALRAGSTARAPAM